MDNIAVVVRELSYLKILQPIMLEFIKTKTPYILYHLDRPLGEKEYNRSTLPKLKQICAKIVTDAKKVVAFGDDKKLRHHLVNDKITKLVSVEIWLWARSYIDFLKTNKIKTYSILYLTDSLWQDDPNSIKSIYKSYHASQYLLETRLRFNKIDFVPNRDKVFGLPIFDGLKNISKGSDVLVLLPNIRSEHVPVAFGNAKRFIGIIEKLYSVNPNLIFKTRRKQWMPLEIKKYAKEIVDDKITMYPSPFINLLFKTQTAITFYSSGIFECAYSGNHIVNIPLSLKTWPWDKKRLKEYFDNTYNFQGVVESISQDDILNGKWKFAPKKVNEIQYLQWVSKYMGGVCDNSAKNIVVDLLI